MFNTITCICNSLYYTFHLHSVSKALNLISFIYDTNVSLFNIIQCMYNYRLLSICVLYHRFESDFLSFAVLSSSDNPNVILFKSNVELNHAPVAADSSCVLIFLIGLGD